MDWFFRTVAEEIIHSIQLDTYNNTENLVPFINSKMKEAGELEYEDRTIEKEAKAAINQIIIELEGIKNK